MNQPLLNAIESEIALGRFRFHVPGHAGRAMFPTALASLFPYDLTELPSLDVLGDPAGVLRDSQREVASAYGTAYSFYLINGASVGIMAALIASGASHVLVPRNAHRSVIHALVLTGATPYWVLPDFEQEWGLWGELSPEAVSACLSDNPQITAMVVTHPTYEGISSNLEELLGLARRFGVAVIVDEAHGSLWQLSQGQMPASAIASGADAVVHSLHKTAGALTQTGLLHLPHGSRLDPQAVQAALNLLQTTSPSYVLLANAESTVAYWVSERGQGILKDHLSRVRQLKHEVSSTCSTIRVYPDAEGLVTTQLYLQSTRLSGEALGERLEETYGIVFESATPYGCLLELNMGLEDVAFEALLGALQRIDSETMSLPPTTLPEANFTLPKMVMTPREAFFSPGRRVTVLESVGQTAREVIAACPPGIPVLIPGERITEAHREHLPETVSVV